MSQGLAGLERLNARVRQDLEALGSPAGWVKPRAAPGGSRALDVVIVGGGQSGLGAAFGLIREGVSELLVLDENPEGQEGPWATYARMITLRTPKHLTAIDFGMPSLTFRAWWEAQFGPEGWAALDKIPRQDWMRYLSWYRAVLGLPVKNRVKVTAVSPAGPGLFRLSVEGEGAPEGGVLHARKVVMATGIQGGGEWWTPDFVKRALPPHLYAHTSEEIDYAALKGGSIGILGGGASAFDNAQHALAEGVAEAHVFVRRADLPRVNPIRHMEVSGLIRGFALLDDSRRYAALDHFLKLNQPPTNDTFARAAAHPGFRLHLGAPWEAVREVEGRAEVTTPHGQFRFDRLVLSTGLKTDVALRPELAELSPLVCLWRDRYRPPEGRANPLIDDHPYLGPGFEFLPKTPEGAEALHGLFAFNYSALASLGLSASAISGLRVALPRLVSGVARQLFLDDQDALIQDYLDYDEVEFEGRWPAR